MTAVAETVNHTVYNILINDQPSELQSKVHQLAGGHSEEDHDRHGSKPLKLIYGQPTSAYTQRGIERRITLIGVNSWRQLRSILGMLLMMMMMMMMSLITKLSHVCSNINKMVT